MEVIATLTAKEGQRDSLIKVILDHVMPMVNEEKGTLVYTVYKHAGDDNKIVFLEKYENQAALGVHSENLKKVGKLMGPHMGGRPVIDPIQRVGGKAPGAVAGAVVAAKKIQAGDRLPAGKFQTMKSTGAPGSVTSEELFKGKRVVLFAVPGAFTPGCSIQLNEFAPAAKQMATKGVDTVACLSTNDIFVNQAWRKASKADDILMLTDPVGEFVTKLGLVMKGTPLRSARFAMIVKDGVVEQLMLDEDAKLVNSSCERVVAKL